MSTSLTKTFIKTSEVDQELELRDLMNDVQSNDLGAGWIDHHSYYSYYLLLYVVIANLERHTHKRCDVKPEP